MMPMKENVYDAIESLQTLLEEALPITDSEHRDEIFDMLSMLERRIDMYISNYGCN